ncbi:MAG: transposase [Planctomycetia bacterium]|nr:transposase [Planctomycetia bacterium]
MPRSARAAVGGLCYHVLNRGNARAEIFHKQEDFAAFLDLLPPACERLPMRILGWCLMPNHFHLILRPFDDGDLGRWMQWLMTSHVRRYHRHYQGEGHVWQGRYKAFPIQADEHLLSVLRYVERNPLRAKLVARAEQWPWGSLSARVGQIGKAQTGTTQTGKAAPGRKLAKTEPIVMNVDLPKILAPSPVKLPRNWAELVNKPQTEAEVAAVRASIQRGAPFGSGAWQSRTAEKLDLEHTLRPRGRPRGTSKPKMIVKK